MNALQKVLAAVSCIFAFSIGKAAQPPQPYDLEQINLPGVGHRNFDQVCVEPPYILLGNAWRIGTSYGGVTLKGNAPGGNSASKPDFTEIFNKPPMPPSTSTEVTLIILDDFSYHDVPVMDSIQPGDPLESGQVLRLSHGEVVVAHARTLLRSAGFNYAYEYRAGSVNNSYQYEKDGQIITIKKVDIGGLRVGGLIQANSTFQTRLINAVSDKGNIVLNMSFYLIPCAVDRAFQKYRFEKSGIKEEGAGNFNPEGSKFFGRASITFTEFIEKTVESNSKLDRDRVIATLFNIPDNHPFRKLLDSLPSNIIKVAASGNFNMPFSTAPGSFNDVISVGSASWAAITAIDEKAMMGTSPNMQFHYAYWSDAGDIYSPGGWFGLLDTYGLCITDTCITEDLWKVRSNPNALEALIPENNYSQFAYLGTSFSSPSVAVYIASQFSRASECYRQQAGKEFRGFNFYKEGLNKFVPVGKYHGPNFKGGTYGVLNKKC